MGVEAGSFRNAGRLLPAHRIKEGLSQLAQAARGERQFGALHDGFGRC